MFQYKTETLLIEDACSRAICTQKIDRSYDSVNFDDFISTLSYSKKLFQSHLRGPSSDEALERASGVLAHAAKTRGPEYKVELHRFMRLVAEKVHTAFQGIDQDSPVESLLTIIDNVTSVFEQNGVVLIELLQDIDGYFGILTRNHTCTKKDVGVLSDYEVIG